MKAQQQASTRYVFGPFEVASGSGELYKNGIRIHISAQPFQILLLLLQNAGDLVSREQLRERIWGEGTFVDFEHGLHAAMNKLRRALGDSADSPRYIQTVTGRGYRFVGRLDTCGPEPHASASALKEDHEPMPTRKYVGLPWWFVIIVAFATVSFAVGWWFHDVTAVSPSPPWRLARLTAEAGLEEAPALSRDGRLVAYSSDPSLNGKRDLFIKHVSGGPPIRLTSDGAGNTTPDFSPDGSRIVFRSNRDGGGIYEMPVFGGEVRLIARGGLNPKVSPDASLVAYWTGAESIAETVPGSGAVWVVPVSGGQPRRIGANLTSARRPIWAPDGKHLLFVGYSSANAFDSSGVDWWIASLKGEYLVRTGVRDALIRGGVQTRDMARDTKSRTPVPAVPDPGCWSETDEAVISTVPSGDTQNLWAIGMSLRSGRASGLLRRMTTGAGSEEDPSCTSAGILAFRNLNIRREIWSQPFDWDRGRAQQGLKRAVETAANQENPSFSTDGRFMAFVSDQSGRPNIWLRELATGIETPVASSSFVQRYPVINASGSKVAFSVYEPNKRVVYVSAPGGVPEKLCEGCLRATDWSRDEKTLLIFGDSPYQIKVLTLASHRQVSLLKHHKYNLLYGHFSPDNRWMSFTVRIRPDRGLIAVAPLAGATLIPESAWNTIAEVGPDDYANWSRDGKTLYFTSSKDGYSCLWGQHIDLRTGRSLGDSFAVRHFHGRNSFGHGGWSVSGGQIGLALVETTSSIWTMAR